MVDEQSWSGFERRPDVDGAALGAFLRRVLGPRLRVARTPAGVAAQVYRVQAAQRVLYVRIAEEDHEDLSVDAALLEHLRAEGLHVPKVVHVEPRSGHSARRSRTTSSSPSPTFPICGQDR